MKRPFYLIFRQYVEIGIVDGETINSHSTYATWEEAAADRKVMELDDDYSDISPILMAVPKMSPLKKRHN